MCGSLVLGCSRAKPAEEEKLPPAPVKVAKAEQVPLAEWTDILGTTQPLPGRVARVTAPIEGVVSSILIDADGKPVKEGQQIKAGTVVVQLDTRIINEHIKQAQVAVHHAEIDVRRLEALMTGGGSNGKGPLVSRVELERARHTLDDAQSKLKALQQQAKYYQLTSPIDGRLGLVQAVPGQTLPIGASVAEVIDLREIDVLCFVPPHAAGRLRLNQTARIEGVNEAVPSGTVVYIAVAAQAETGNFAVKVRFENPKLRLRANGVFPVRVQTEPEKERWTIPESALQEDHDPPLVAVVEDIKEEEHEGKKFQVGKAHKLRARIGVRDRHLHRVEILSLEDPEKKQKIELKDVQFIVEGGSGLHDDDAVKLEEEKH